MTREEQLNLKKDTLWDIHEADKLIACLEHKLNKAQEALQEIVDAMKLSAAARAAAGRGDQSPRPPAATEDGASRMTASGSLNVTRAAI